MESEDAGTLINKGNDFYNVGNYDEAITYYEKAIKLDSKNAIAYSNCGLALYNLAEYKNDKEKEDLFNRTFKNFKKVTELDPKDTSAFHNCGYVLYELAEIKQEENKYVEAVDWFIKSKQEILSIFVSLYNDNKTRTFQPKHFYKLLDKDVFFLKTIEKDRAKLNEYKDIYLRSIFIISQLHVNNENEKTVAHYREKNISQKLLFDSTSEFRLNAINYSNDPTEGKTLLDFLYGKDKYKTDEEPNTEYEAFAGCFTFNYDNLTLFRLYGKEDDKEGTGLSLVFRNNFFSKEAKIPVGAPKINSPKMSIDNYIEEDKLALFRCIYIDPYSETKQPIVAVGQKEEYLFYRENIENEFGGYSAYIDKIIERVRDGIRKLKERIEKKQIENEKLDSIIVGQLLLNLRYLVKHVAFKEEQECRMIKIHNLNDKEIEMKDEYKQMYIKYSPKVSEHIDRIYFGPKAEGFELFKSMLKKQIKDKSIPCKKSTQPFGVSQNHFTQKKFLLPQCQNFFSRQIGYASYKGRVKPFFEHILGCLQNTFFHAPSFTLSNAFLLSISQGIHMVAETLHITFVVHKLLIRKVRNSCYIKKTFEHHFLETLGYLSKVVCVLKDEKHPVKVTLALPLGFVKPSKADINQTHKIIIANLWVKIVGKGEVLNNLITVFPKISIKVKKTESIDNRNIIVVRDFLSSALHSAFLCKISHSHTEVKETSLDKVLLLLYLHLNNEPSAGGILALNIKHSTSLFPGLAKLDCVNDFHAYNRLFENPIKESVEEEQKQVCALLASKGFFKSEVQCKWSKLRQFFGHSNPRGKNVCDIIKPLPCRANVEKGNIEKM